MLKGDATTLWRWLRRETLAAVPGLRGQAAFVAFCMAAAFAVGFAAPLVNPGLRIPLTHDTDAWVANFIGYYNLLGGEGTLVSLAVWQNSRVLLAGAFMSMFTFGVVGLILAMAPLGILGFVFAQFVLSGVSPVVFLAAVAPHSLFEVPAVILATAAAFRLGVVFIDPPKGKTVGAAWLHALSDLVKTGVLVLGLLVVAGAVEVYVTPRLVQLVMAGLS
ncbi:MAG: stage II sporulation protein M [Anaerolineae bacterium]|nr:stage II sporulation protein M [Anaerolineae bacterium]